MGMPIIVEIADRDATSDAFEKVFSYFCSVDERFSTYKETSEVSKINRGELHPSEYSDDMKTVLALSEETKAKTDGYFNIFNPAGIMDPSGLVKGWAINNAAKILESDGYKNFYVDAGGDVEARGINSEDKKWRVGILNPINQKEIVKVLHVSDRGVATSGTYIRGNHIYNPKANGHIIDEIVSLTVIGPNVYEADRFVTAAFAMGKEGINFIENLEGFEGYMIDRDGIATMTSGFHQYENQ